MPLTFRKSSGDCPPVTHFDLKLEAETSAAAAFYQWAADVCTGQGAFTLDVTNTSSNAAREQFFAGNVDIGVSSLPPQPAELPPDPRPYTVTPVDLTGIVIAYNIVDPVTKQQITDMKLSPRLVARLLSSSEVVAFFDDPEFKKLNPHHHWPVSASEPGVRAEKNADTWIVTNWLQHNQDARNFLDNHDKYGVHVNTSWKNVLYPTDVFESRNATGAYVPHTGEEGVALKLFHATKPADGVSSIPSDVGFMGVLDLPTARRFDLPTAQLTDGVGQPTVSATDQHPSRVPAYEARPRRASTSFRPTLSDPEAYPLTKVDHALTPNVVGNALTKARIKYLLAYARVGPGQRRSRTRFRSVPRCGGSADHDDDHDHDDHDDSDRLDDARRRGRLADAELLVGNRRAPRRPRRPRRRLPARRRSDGGNADRGTANRVTPKLALISQTDGLILPIVIGLGILALLYLLVDLARRRGPAFVVAARQRFAARRAGTELPGPPAAGIGRARRERHDDRDRRGRGLAHGPRGAGARRARRKPAPQPNLVATVVRRGLLIFAGTILAFLAFALWFSGLSHARSQVGLQRRFRTELGELSAPSAESSRPVRRSRSSGFRASV